MDPRRILAIADRCVLCGMCLPHCPTYRLAREEAESPRGRIVLAQALASGRLAPDSILATHIDSCLGCRACESVCPSGVAYGALLRDTRELLAEHRPIGIARRVGLRMLTGPRGRKLLAGAAALQRRFSLIEADDTSFLGRAVRHLPPPPLGDALPHYLPAIGEVRGRVALFVGCTGEMFDGEALLGSLLLLTRSGFEVSIPAEQQCCGALHAHSGAGDQTRSLAQANGRAFSGDADAVVAIASGCAAMLADYLSVIGHAMDAPVYEVVEFLSTRLGTDLRFRPLSRRVAIHEPCSQRRGLKAGGAAARLLAPVTAMDLFDLPENDRCCGAAGSHMLTHPETADELGMAKASLIRRRGAEIVVTTNVGCALHLRAHLPPEPPIEVLHPVSLLARQLLDPG